LAPVPGIPQVFPSRARGLIATFAIVPALAAEVAFGVPSHHHFAFFGTSLLISVTAAMSGALLGFLFGIPRTVPGSETSRLPYTGNTNLEQVSDWLTKILIGVGLTQIGKISATAGTLVRYVGPTFAPGPGGTIFASTVIIYFGTLGFFAGWLPTRVLLGPALSRVDREALDRFIEAQAAADSGDHARAAALRQDALALSERAARRYESLRSLPPDPRRTAEMEATVETARRAAESAQFSPDVIQAIFQTGSMGDRVRVFGFMQGDPRLANFDIALDGIQHSLSAFEQLHALRVMLGLAPSLTPDEVDRLRTALAAQTGAGGHIHEGSLRWQVVQEIRRSAGLPPDS
jgi:hypothetical protein